MFVVHAGGDRTQVAVTRKNEILEANAIIYYVARHSPVETSLRSEYLS